MELRRAKEDLKEMKLKLEAETNGKNKAELDLDNALRRLSSQVRRECVVISSGSGI